MGRYVFAKGYGNYLAAHRTAALEQDNSDYHDVLAREGERITRLLGLLRECEKVEPDALGRGLLRRIQEEVGE